ncbi:hypothetical protein KIN20_031569 [Parelaphostrongylus tenuis]|uniref:Uncharacterized protein n=1 Tax=Parelaphostrongylus tenuis TaxID=148309 RepID=A0AAD5R5P2_PARTN|nr:hypothetical protein KIN20_031569 [Parelaphostrongylus tenuis]
MLAEHKETGKDTDVAAVVDSNNSSNGKKQKESFFDDLSFKMTDNKNFARTEGHHNSRSSANDLSRYDTHNRRHTQIRPPSWTTVASAERRMEYVLGWSEETLPKWYKKNLGMRSGALWSGITLYAKLLQCN